MLGLQAWGVSLGHGSFITMEFGEPREKQGQVHGEWHFWVYGCAWRLEEPGQVLAASEDERADLAAAVTHLELLKLGQFEVLPPALDTTLTFEGDVVLRLFSIYTDPRGMADWMLFTPDDQVLVVGPGSSWTFHPSSEPTPT
jgi:hypothetical protein